MKKIILIFSIGIFSITSNAQVNLGSSGGTLSFRKSADFKETEAAGSRYYIDRYQNARVNKGDQNFLIRYNAYSDIMEYKNGTDMLDLIKEKNAHFTFQDGSVYELFVYDLKGTSVDRYHKVLVSNNNIKISKFQSIKLIPASKASNSYDKDTQAEYKPNEEVYFITYNNQTFEFDGKQKSLEKIIPGKSDAIKAFYKENKIKENDSDMIKLGNFLATI
ncbi:hypothetical protein [Paenimyroides baculatum]|uniref:Uncharacterized protein n=1 Tax=Paenimyroides baculatum TaxID=2608000 RepID=A0A5M6CYH8_9FLAO|nr:hypothetical protein [Paenimyroides baculatum]KAA5538339.1 hypothetical protein F0460_01695 [Paenimyroides baculatum]